ncbi:hypothetical protein N018_18265 [Pseudomonas syringae CC1557]|uniref:Uncharacterized protein n=1 Tax=Pseudomonas syringae CC1557 TaxID=1357279 RepID=W0MYJ0_PSESX|nr:hypothetical protein N018_18265 [Pseudomonas syringae CC1557]
MFNPVQKNFIERQQVFPDDITMLSTIVVDNLVNSGTLKVRNP